MKKLKYLIIILLLFIGIRNIYAFDKTEKIYDYAQILTEKEENKLKSEIDKYINKHNFDMVIVTVKHYMQKNLQDYIKEFYTKNEFGIEPNKDGIIIAIDLKDKQDNIDIKTFGKAISLYSEDEIKNILIEIDNEKGYYDKLDKFINYSNKYIKEQKTNNSTIYDVLYSMNWLVIITISLLAPFILISIWLFKIKKRKKEGNNNYYIKQDSVVIEIKKDEFMTTNTKKVRISSNK